MGLWLLPAIACAVSLILLMPGQAVQVGAQTIPTYALEARRENFDVAEDIAVLHYYGVAGWGIQWRDKYLLLAPYFSNHGFLDFFRKRDPDLAAIRASIQNTPFTEAGLILVGHGHVDHAADIPAYRAAGIPNGQAGLVGNTTTLNLLADLLPPNNFIRCAKAPTVDGETLDDCALEGFRITALKSAHAPNVKVLGQSLTVSTGTLDQAYEGIPERPADYLAGATWAYLIDLLDPNGEIVLRIHYMDAVAGATDSKLPAAMIAAKNVDIFIACVPGFDYVSDYPEWAIQQGDSSFVFMGHWEDFFRSREQPLRPVTLILNENKLNDFALRVEQAINPGKELPGPINKSNVHCPQDRKVCGPRGDHWSLPIPGETFHFSSRLNPD